MKKFLKKGIVVSALGFTLLAGFAQTNAYAQSQDISDKGYNFTFDKFGGEDAVRYTEARKKYNTTSVYMKSQNVGGDYTFSGKVMKSDGTDVSMGKSYKFTDGTVQYMNNNAVERFGSGTKVKVRAQTGWNMVDVQAYGVWSPDSV